MDIGKLIMSCINSIDDTYYLMCSKTNNKCIFSKYCNTEQKFIFNERLDSRNCLYNNNDNTLYDSEIPSNAFEITKTIINLRTGKAMIYVEDNVFWFKYSTYEKYKNQKYIYLKEENGKMLASFTEDYND